MDKNEFQLSPEDQADYEKMVGKVRESAKDVHYGYCQHCNKHTIDVHAGVDLEQMNINDFVDYDFEEINQRKRISFSSGGCDSKIYHKKSDDTYIADISYYIGSYLPPKHIRLVFHGDVTIQSFYGEAIVNPEYLYYDFFDHMEIWGNKIYVKQ